MKMTSENNCTCRALYEEGAALLAGLEEGRLDARLLLEHFCGIDTHRLLADPDLAVPQDAARAYLEGIRRRAAREPLAYITGSRSFMGLTFKASPAVLIPEQDTENLVEEALRYLEDGSRILDLCTGSGCILLSLLRYSNGCAGIGTDISEEALDVARENARLLGLEEQVRWEQGDLFEALDGKSCFEPLQKTVQCAQGDLSGAPDGLACRAQGDLFEAFDGQRFDLIISNPPYIPTGVIGTLAPEVRCAEPRLALDGGADGLDFYRRIIREAPKYLVIGGRLLLEIGHDQAQAVRSLLEEHGYYGVEILKDYGGNDRVATAVRSTSQI